MFPLGLPSHSLYSHLFGCHPPVSQAVSLQLAVVPDCHMVSQPLSCTPFMLSSPGSSCEAFWPASKQGLSHHHFFTGFCCAQPSVRQSQGVRVLEEVEYHSYTMSLLTKVTLPGAWAPCLQHRWDSRAASPTDRWNHWDHIFNFFLTNNEVWIIVFPPIKISSNSDHLCSRAEKSSKYFKTITHSQKKNSTL